MGVSQHVVTWLREQGHDATHLRDEGLQHSKTVRSLPKPSASHALSWPGT